MDLPLHPSSHAGTDLASSTDALHRELRSLRLTLQILLVSLVIFGGSIGIYLFRQVSLLRRQAENTTRVAQQMVQNFNENLATPAQNFEKQLVEFARTNPDFQARIGKFFAPNPSAADGAKTGPSNSPAEAPSTTVPK